MGGRLRILRVKQVVLPHNLTRVSANLGVIDKLQKDAGGYIYSAEQIFFLDRDGKYALEIGPGSVYFVDENIVITNAGVNKKLDDKRLEHRGHY